MPCREWSICTTKSPQAVCHTDNSGRGCGACTTMMHEWETCGLRSLVCNLCVERSGRAASASVHPWAGVNGTEMETGMGLVFEENECSSMWGMLDGGDARVLSVGVVCAVWAWGGECMPVGREYLWTLSYGNRDANNYGRATAFGHATYSSRCVPHSGACVHSALVLTPHLGCRDMLLTISSSVGGCNLSETQDFLSLG
ncbi:hypothetical protein C8R44DRAFT_754154 [Mycena epipterygia]|nr:hypothetical protein C8R44DRAFT_754154 [Mycena epipterygia]